MFNGQPIYPPVSYRTSQKLTDYIFLFFVQPNFYHPQSSTHTHTHTIALFVTQLHNNKPLNFSFCSLFFVHMPAFRRKPNYSMGWQLHDSHSHSHGAGGGHGAEHEHTENINVRAAFIHVLGDVLQSVGVFIAALLIYFIPSWQLADPICTFVFSIVVLATTITILKDTLLVRYI